MTLTITVGLLCCISQGTQVIQLGETRILSGLLPNKKDPEWIERNLSKWRRARKLEIHAKLNYAFVFQQHQIH